MDDTRVSCPSPQYPSSAGNTTHRIRKRETHTDKEPWLVGFEMDGVMSVQNLPDNLARIVYIENPSVIPFKSTQKYAKVIIIKVIYESNYFYDKAVVRRNC